MMAQGVHCVDVLHFLLGQHVVEVAALTDGQTPAQPLERWQRCACGSVRGPSGPSPAGSKCRMPRTTRRSTAVTGGLSSRRPSGSTLQGSLEVVSETVQTRRIYAQDPLGLYTRQVEAFNRAIQQQEAPTRLRA